MVEKATRSLAWLYVKTRFLDSKILTSSCCISHLKHVMSRAISHRVLVSSVTRACSGRSQINTSHDAMLLLCLTGSGNAFLWEVWSQKAKGKSDAPQCWFRSGCVKYGMANNVQVSSAFFHPCARKFQVMWISTKRMTLCSVASVIEPISQQAYTTMDERSFLVLSFAPFCQIQLMCSLYFTNSRTDSKNYD